MADALHYAPLPWHFGSEPRDGPLVVMPPVPDLEALRRGDSDALRRTQAAQLAADCANIALAFHLLEDKLPSDTEALLALGLPYMAVLGSEGVKWFLVPVAPEEAPQPGTVGIRLQGELLELWIDRADAATPDWRGPLLPPEGVVFPLAPGPFRDQIALELLGGHTLQRWNLLRDLGLWPEPPAGFIDLSPLGWGYLDHRTYTAVSLRLEGYEQFTAPNALAHYYLSIVSGYPMVGGREARSVADLASIGEPLFAPSRRDGTPYRMVDVVDGSPLEPGTVRWLLQFGVIEIERVDEDGAVQTLVRVRMGRAIANPPSIAQADPDRLMGLDRALRCMLRDYIRIHGCWPSTMTEVFTALGITPLRQQWYEGTAAASEPRDPWLRVEACDDTREIRIWFSDGVEQRGGTAPTGDLNVEEMDAVMGGGDFDPPDDDGKNWRVMGLVEVERVVWADPMEWRPRWGRPVNPQWGVPSGQSALGSAWNIWVETTGRKPQCVEELLQARAFFFLPALPSGSPLPVLPIDPQPLTFSNEYDSMMFQRDAVPRRGLEGPPDFTGFWFDEGVLRIIDVTPESIWINQPLPWWTEPLRERESVAMHEPIAILRPRILAALQDPATLDDPYARFALVEEYIQRSDQLNEHRLLTVIKECEGMLMHYLKLYGAFPPNWEAVLQHGQHQVPANLTVVEDVDEDWDEQRPGFQFWIHRAKGGLIMMVQPTLPASVWWDTVFEFDYLRGEATERNRTESDKEGLTQDDLELLFAAHVPMDPLPST
ncbi:MAG: hypothetical protein ABI743_00920 [bacterium]